MAGCFCQHVKVNRGRSLHSPRRLRGWVRSISPELVSGASDNDPTNVGTAVAVGASTAYQLAWVALLVAPLLGVVQTIAAHVGSVSHNDLQSLTLQRYGRRVAVGPLGRQSWSSILVTIAADLQAGAAGIGLLAGVDSRWLVVPLGCALVGLLLVGKYHLSGSGLAAFSSWASWLSASPPSSLAPTGQACSGRVSFQRCRYVGTWSAVAWRCWAPR